MKRTILILALLAAGCARKPTIAPITPDTTILAFGDSLTAGSGANKAQSYPSVLAELLGCTVINAGKPGEVTADGMARLKTSMNEQKTDCQAIQRNVRAARMLGVLHHVAEQNARDYYEGAYRFHPYFSKKCGKGKELDENLSEAIW